MSNHAETKKISYLYSPPKHITPLGEPPESINAFLEDAIVRRDMLTTLQNNMCAELRYPITIVELKPCRHPDNEKKSINLVKACRNDSNLDVVSHRRVCRNLRKCLGAKRCFLCDDLIARLFENVKVSNMGKDVVRNIGKFKESLVGKKFYSRVEGKSRVYYDHLMPIFEDDAPHCYIKTICPMSGYTELAFPIIVDDSVMGVVFIGQISVKTRQKGYDWNKEAFVEESVRDAFLNSIDVQQKLQEYIDEVPKRKAKLHPKCKTKEEITDYLLSPDVPNKDEPHLPIDIDAPDTRSVGVTKSDERLILDDTAGNYNKPNSYEKFIEDVSLSVKDFEKRLQDELKRAREKYIYDYINGDNGAQHIFYKNMKDVQEMLNKDAFSSKPLQKFWKILEDVMSELIDALEISNVTIFGTSEIHPTPSGNSKLNTENRLEPLMSSGFIAKNEGIYFDMSMVDSATIPNPNKPEEFYNDSSPFHNGIQCQDDSIKKKLSNSIKHLMSFPMSGKKRLPLVTLILYNSKDKPSNMTQIVSNNLRNFLTSIFYIYSSIIGFIAESRASNAMMIYRHETSQLAAAINKINLRYIKPENSIIAVSRQNSSAVFETIQECVTALNKLSEMLGTNDASNAVNEQLLTTIFKHEISRVSSALLRICDRYFRSYSNDKKRDIYEDIYSLSLQLQSISDRIKIIQRRHILDPKKFENIFVIKEVFYRWASAFSLAETARYLEFIMPSTSQRDDLRPSIYSDLVLLNQIVFNIFGNAIKYAYRGTAIYLNYERLFENSRQKIIEIVDYGIEITKDQVKPYELYFIDDNAVGYSDESSGMGLFVAKQAVTLLGGEISHTCKKVSDFVVPYIQPFLDICKENPSTASESFIEELKAEQKRLKREGIYQRILSNKRITERARGCIPITESEIIEEIENRTATYEVRFEVTLYA